MKEKNQIVEMIKYVGLAIWSFLKFKMPIGQLLALYLIRQAVINQIWQSNPRELLMLVLGYLAGIGHVIVVLIKVVLL